MELKVLKMKAHQTKKKHSSSKSHRNYEERVSPTNFTTITMKSTTITMKFIKITK
jgi:hypothetical protein